MQTRFFVLLIFFIFVNLEFCFPQSQTQYFPEKQGTYVFSNAIASRGAIYVSFGNNVKRIAEYFYQEIPVLNSNKGFDLAISLLGYFDEDYLNRSWNYGLRGELEFAFQLFIEENGKQGKWTIEPPKWVIDINNTEQGHGGMRFNDHDFKNHDFLQQLFLVFPFVEEIAPGVHYCGNEARTCGSLVIFNPERQPYWLPVTVREFVTAKLEFYEKTNMEIYNYLKPIVDKMSEDELNSWAYNGSDEAFLNVNGKGDGLQFMRFNPQYWDKTLPKTAIQLITIPLSTRFRLDVLDKEEHERVSKEYFSIHGFPNYAQLVRDFLPLQNLGSLIDKSK